MDKNMLELDADTLVERLNAGGMEEQEAAARIAELEARLAEAWQEVKAAKAAMYSEHELREEENAVHFGEMEELEARASRLEAALRAVEAYMVSEESPLYHLWESGDICSWDDNPREKWEHVLEDLRDLENFEMTELDIGMGVKWEAVTIYRTVITALLARHALAPPEQREGE